MTHSKPVRVIAGSLRAWRLAIPIASWVAEIGRGATDILFEVLRLPRAHIEANSGEIDPAAEFAGPADDLRQAFGELASALAI